MLKPEARIKEALDIACNWGSTDGAHHKSWVIDQMVRALTECPVIEDQGMDVNGLLYSFERLGESEEYNEFVRQAKSGEYGPNSYEWDIGIAP